MEITEIIKEAFIFPSQNLEKLAIYIVLTFVLALLAVFGVITALLGINDGSFYFVLTFIFLILGIIVALIITGYQVGVLKSGIDHDESAPSLELKNDFITGLKMLAVSIVYFIIPAIVGWIMVFITNIPGQIMDIVQKTAVSHANATAMAGSSSTVVTGVSDAAIASLTGSITVSALVTLVVFIIFAFLQAMGESRLANTGELGEAINIPEAFRDITRIGVGKVLAVILLIVIIILVIQAVLGYLYGQIPYLSILGIIVTPYLAFFSQRAIGLLYSEIA
ncbi:DUF4013 domain-containing protein [Methanobrevibacter sp.]|uniref:DUF4013 domain-containing protein n=1 Tax=Methanobrevibacter sp. TaxID=66852 RepID=UPI003868E2AE